MATVTRPDGAEIHWEQAGEGPLALVTTQVFGSPAVQHALNADLASDHRVLTYDPRGTGRSSRGGPFDNRTDAEDLIALLEEAGEPAVVVGLGNVAESAVVAAARRPDLTPGVVVPFGNPGGVRAARDSSALLGSTSVLEGLNDLLANDYRAGLRTVISTGNPQMPEEEVRRRVDAQVEYCPAEAAVGRMESWWKDGAVDEARAIGDRLWLLQHPHNPWFPADMIEPTRELLPEARIEEIEDGHLSRPDLTSAVVRRITADNPN